jgi:hypothetical protein
MRKISGTLSFITLAPIAFTLFLMGCSKPKDVTGTWDFTVNTPQSGVGKPVLTLKQEGRNVTGTFQGRLGELKLEGSLQDTALVFDVKTPEGDMRFKGTLDGNGSSVNGTFQAATRGDGTFSGVKRSAP